MNNEENLKIFFCKNKDYTYNFCWSLSYSFQLRKDFLKFANKNQFSRMSYFFSQKSQQAKSFFPVLTRVFLVQEDVSSASQSALLQIFFLFHEIAPVK
jgi:hypothetical protein